MKELKEALVYATANGTVGFALYGGSALYFGQELYPAFTSALGVGLLAFGSYLVREHDEVSIQVEEILPPKKHSRATNFVKRNTRFFVPASIRRRGLFRFI